MELKQFGNLEVRIFNNFEELSKQAAEIFAAECEKTLNPVRKKNSYYQTKKTTLSKPLSSELSNGVKKKAIFTVSLCGGKTPQRLFELLATDFKNKIFWQKVYIFFGDERERKESLESNFQIAFKIWLEKIIKDIPNFENNIHRIKMELGLENGAKEYEKEINKFAPEGFGLSFNGAGADGHRNGIFPENPNWKNKIWDLPESVNVYGYKLPPEINPYTKRITLTPWFLNKSKVNILLLSGKEKSDLLRKITIEKENYTKRVLPAITFNDVPTIVLADKAVASKL